MTLPDACALRGQLRRFGEPAAAGAAIDPPLGTFGTIEPTACFPMFKYRIPSTAGGDGKTPSDTDLSAGRGNVRNIATHVSSGTTGSVAEGLRVASWQRSSRPDRIHVGRVSDHSAGHSRYG